MKTCQHSPPRKIPTWISTALLWSPSHFSLRCSITRSALSFSSLHSSQVITPFLLKQLNLHNDFTALDLGDQPAGAASSCLFTSYLHKVSLKMWTQFNLVFAHCSQRSSLGRRTIPSNTVQLTSGVILLRQRSTRSRWQTSRLSTKVLGVKTELPQWNTAVVII